MTRTTLTPLARKTIASLFAQRHESPQTRELCRSSIRDARLWLDLMADQPTFRQAHGKRLTH